MEKINKSDNNIRVFGLEKLAAYFDQPKNSEHIRRLQTGDRARILLGFAILHELIDEYGKEAKLSDVLKREAELSKLSSANPPANPSPGI